MQIDVHRKTFSVEDYHRMAETGILTADDRVELIDGDIVQMSPIGDRHAACVDCGAHLLINRISGMATIRVQNPLRLGEHNELQPDLVVARYRKDYYGNAHPTPADVFLVIEVADATLQSDLSIKLPVYSRSGIPEVWVEDLQHRSILVFRNPDGNEYGTRLQFGPGQKLSPISFSNMVFCVDELLGPVMAE